MSLNLLFKFTLAIGFFAAMNSHAGDTTVDGCDAAAKQTLSSIAGNIVDNPRTELYRSKLGNPDVGIAYVATITGNGLRKTVAYSLITQISGGSCVFMGGAEIPVPDTSDDYEKLQLN